jgi:pimeloyl-ACP methyl ester carboxylesterase
MSDASQSPPSEGLRSPLGRLGGARPPAPAWFDEALANAPERSLVATPRGGVEMLTWGERGKPGLLFVHGNRAHADWWSFIAPFFARSHRVAALSLAGMGGSEWRERYDFTGFADDFEAVAAAAGLGEGGRKPVLIGHSMGGGLVLQFAARRPERLHAAMVIDIGLGGAPAELVLDRERKIRAERERPPEQRGLRVYRSLAEALAHFRLSPLQPLENLFAVDYIARHALRPAPLPDGSGEGWTWKFDPDIWERLDRESLTLFSRSRTRVEVPVAHLWGELSPLKGDDGAGPPLPADAPCIGIPAAHHHVPIDQPLALVAAIRAVLAAWRA